MKHIVVGAGLTGSTVARKLVDEGKKVEVWEKKDHIAGAIYDFKNENGEYIHKYGPHIFHTNNKEVFQFTEKFTKWNKYEHKVLGNISDKLCPIPFNFKSIELCFSKEKSEILKNKLKNLLGNKDTITIGELKKIKDCDLQELADFVYKNVFYNYTKKQWGVPPESLGEEVMGRVPVRASYDDRYFTDAYQAIPDKGYSTFIKNMLNHPNITVKLNKNSKDHISFSDNHVLIDDIIFSEPIIYTACIEELFNYRFGLLPYRSLEFVFKTAEWPFQPVSVVNYPNVEGFTRITEFPHFLEDYSNTKSTILYEYPKEYSLKSNLEPLYPIPNNENHNKYNQYISEIENINNFYVGGRLGKYQYINMDVAIEDGIKIADKILGT